MRKIDRKEKTKIIGKRGLFSGLPELRDSLFYISGIASFHFKNGDNMSGPIISILAYEKGIEIFIPANGDNAILAYSEIQNYTLHNINESELILHLKLKNKSELKFGLNKKNKNHLLFFLKSTDIKPNKVARTEVDTKKDLQVLSQYFFPTNEINFSKEVRTLISGKIKTISINKNELKWNNDIISIGNISGVCFTKSQVEYRGITTPMSYEIFIHTLDKSPYKISFGKTLGIGRPEGEILYSEILNSLFEILIKPRLFNWTQQLIDNKTITTKKCQISRDGLFYMKKKIHMIEWENLNMKRNGMDVYFFSQIDLSNKFSMSLSNHIDAWPISSFVEFLISKDQYRQLITG